MASEANDVLEKIEKSEESSDLMASSLSDFACFPMENMMSSSSTKSQYSQVVFHDLPDVWPTDSDMVCSYSLTDNVCPQPGDKIALFKVGWSKVCEYITFQRVSTERTKNEGLTVTFDANSLPKEDKDFYQLCYVTSGNVIAGASTAFCFRAPNESELVGIEDPFNPGMIIFKSRIACLQSELKKKIEANETLLVKHDLLENNFLILQKEFNKCEEELKKKQLKIEELSNQMDESKDKDEELKKVTLSCESFRLMHMSDSAKVADLKKQLDDAVVDKKVLEERLNNSQMIEQQQTNEINKLANRIDLLRSDLNVAEEKAKKAEMGRFSSLDALIEENKCLKDENGKVVEQLMEKEQKLETMSIYLKSIEDEKAEYDKKLKDIIMSFKKLEKEHEMLSRRAEFLEKYVKEKNDFIEGQQKQIELLQKEVEDAKKMVGSDSSLASSIAEKENEITELKRTIENLQSFRNPSSEEQEILAASVESLKSDNVKCKNRIDDLIQQFDNMELVYQMELGNTSAVNDKLKKEVEDLKKKNEELMKSSKDEVFSPMSAIRAGLEAGQSAINKTLGFGEDMDKKYKELLSEKSSLRNELVQTRHEKRQLERILKEHKENNAALKSRINVLEIELSTSKKQPQNITCSTAMLEQVETFNKNMPNIITLNSFLAEQTLSFKSEVENEKKKNALLQQKVEDLLRNDAEMCEKLEKMRNSYESEGDRQKIRVLEEQLAEMRTRLMGTISIESTKRLRDELHNAKQQLALLMHTLKQKDEEIARLSKTLPNFIDSTF